MSRRRGTWWLVPWPVLGALLFVSIVGVVVAEAAGIGVVGWLTRCGEPRLFAGGGCTLPNLGLVGLVAAVVIFGNVAAGWLMARRRVGR